MNKQGIVLLLVALMVFAAATTAGADPRTNRVGFSAHLMVGESSEDPAAQIAIEADYTLFDGFALCAGYAYVDDYLIQLQCVSASIKGYFPTFIVDAFLQPTVQLSFAGSAEPQLVFTGRAGLEWQSPWLFFVGAEVAAVFSSESIGWLIGGFVGLRL